MTPTTATLYSKPSCVQCMATVRKLATQGHTLPTIDVSADPDALAYVSSLGHQQAPVIVLANGDSWSGYQPALIMEHFPKAAA